MVDAALYPLTHEREGICISKAQNELCIAAGYTNEAALGLARCIRPTLQSLQDILPRHHIDESEKP
ncbi:hypothetical protein UFOVP817_20 [uncultured Caudovirales phage]|uniref:Uncharacterized protein n=1 Tax=uncultured Caudovirales phage TaxID=2100421 RepID=A0A6J5P1I6_9CAUD|nr:hypothetical protein UFOVP817_20 [uncultured Caudovirales phage]